MALPFSRITARNVGKIEIDQTFLDYKVADAGHTRNIKHLIGQGEGIGECGLLVGHPEQVLVLG